MPKPRPRVVPGPSNEEARPGRLWVAGTTQSRAAKLEAPLPAMPLWTASLIAAQTGSTSGSLTQAGHAGYPRWLCTCLPSDAGWPSSL